MSPTNSFRPAALHEFIVVALVLDMLTKRNQRAFPLGWCSKTSSPCKASVKSCFIVFKLIKARHCARLPITKTFLEQSAVLVVDAGEDFDLGEYTFRFDVHSGVRW